MDNYFVVDQALWQQQQLQQQQQKLAGESWFQSIGELSWQLKTWGT